LFSTIGSVLGFVGGNMYSNYVNEDKKWLQKFNIRN
jgi:hypothetical protein